VDTSSQACLFHAWKASSRLVPKDESVNKLQLQRSSVKLVRPLSTVDNTRYACVSHSRQWSDYTRSLSEMVFFSQFVEILKITCVL